jgi:NADPH-dependent curcumin reductase CurA
MQSMVITLARRPSGQLQRSDFGIGTLTLPELAADQALVATRWLSIDPYLRGLLDETPFVGLPVPLGGPVAGRGIGEVMASRAEALRPGDLVFGDLGWQSHSIQSPGTVRPVLPGRHPATWQLGVLGVPGITAWLALRCIAEPRPGDAVVVSSAAGTVGSAAGQIAQAMGCKTIGLAGGARKAALLRNELGFDAAIDYRALTDLATAVVEQCPGGVDVYFDNVGGPMLDAMLPAMKPLGRVVVCGYLSAYEAGGAESGLANARLISFRRLKVQGFSVRDHAAAHVAAAAALTELADAGKLKQIETICEGLTSAPDALVDLLRGSLVGKVIVACR